MAVHFDVTQDTPAVILVPFSRLRPGHDYPGCDINMRKTYAPSDVMPLADSIRRKGVIQSLLVRIAPDLSDALYIIAGGLRYCALARLVEEGTYTEDQPVPVIVRNDLTDADALDLSLTENDCRLPPHPIDRYEAFAALEELGLSPVGIGLRFGIEAKQVKRSLALGALSPVIRAAWREGQISDDVAKAFTLARETKVQERIFEQLQKQRRLWPSVVTDAIRGDAEDVAPLLAFVGHDAYQDAGGAITEDLFGEDHIVSDAGLLAAMVNDKIDRECVRLVADGWAWAKPAAALAGDWKFWGRTEPLTEPTPEETAQLEKLDARREALDAKENEQGGLTDSEIEEYDTLGHAREGIETAIRRHGFSDHQKSISGCVLWLDAGDLRFAEGVIRPGAREETAPQTEISAPAAVEETPHAPTAKREAAEISPKTAYWLSHTLTEATAEMLAAAPELALAAMLAGFARSHMSGPVRLSHNGQGSADLDLTTPGPFEELLARFRQRSTDQNLALLAHVAAAALDFRKDDPVHHPLLAPAVAALCDALPGLDDCLRRKFDAKAYFESAPRAVALRAIVEVLGEQKCHALRLSTKGKSELAKFALANVAPAGWLPPQLRTPTYRLMSSLEGDTPEAKDDAAKPSAKKRSRK